MASSIDRQAAALKGWVFLSRASAALAAKAAADIERHGLTPAEFGILEALHHRGPLRLGELKEKILVTGGGITYLVDRLVERALVERRRCDEDRRATFASLTVEGECLIRAIFPGHAEVIERCFDVLDDEELQRLTDLLGRVGRSTADRP